MKFDPEESPTKMINRAQFLNWGAIFQFLVVILALILGAVVGCPPLDYIHWDWNAAMWGVLSVLPLFVYLYLSLKSNLKSFTGIKEFLITHLGPLLSQCRWQELFGFSIIVGFGEELLFRGVLQNWMIWYGPVMAIILSNIIFSLAHSQSVTYIIVTFFIGLYLGASVYLTDDQNLLVPMIAHTLYDFVAFLVIKNIYLERAKDSSSEETTF